MRNFVTASFYLYILQKIIYIVENALFYVGEISNKNYKLVLDYFQLPLDEHEYRTQYLFK